MTDDTEILSMPSITVDTIEIQTRHIQRICYSVRKGTWKVHYNMGDGTGYKYISFQNDTERQPTDWCWAVVREATRQTTVSHPFGLFVTVNLHHWTTGTLYVIE